VNAFFVGKEWPNLGMLDKDKAHSQGEWALMFIYSNVAIPLHTISVWHQSNNIYFKQKITKQ
jgi:hypothetical protein